MSLRDSLKSFVQASPYIPPLPEVPATVAAGNRILVEGSATLRPPEDLDAVCERIRAKLEKKEALDLRDLRRAPWCIWSSCNPVCGHQHLVEGLLAQIAEAGRRMVFRTLAAAWLYHFKPDGLCSSLIGNFLSRHASELGDPWSEAHKNFCIFEPTIGPGRIVETATKYDLCPDDILGKFGFRDTLSAIGYREHLYRLGFQQYEKGKNSDPMGRLEMVRKWIYRDGKVRFEGLRTAAARAALDPFDDEMPDKGTRDTFLNLVLDLLRDPRSNPGLWNGCDKSEKITRRWLTEQSLRQFFDVVDRVAQQVQWPYRRAFWNALYERHYIDDAWVVFESAGAHEAWRMFGKNIGFGRFERENGIDKGHSVLLLRLGTLVVAEWSHNGSCNIWDERDGERGPKLHQRLYRVSDLRKERGRARTAELLAQRGIFGHHGADTYSWQERIADHLRKRGGIILNRSDYRLRP